MRKKSKKLMVFENENKPSKLRLAMNRFDSNEKGLSLNKDTNQLTNNKGVRSGSS